MVKKWKLISGVLFVLLCVAILAGIFMLPSYNNYQTIKKYSIASFGESKYARYFAVPDIIYLTDDNPEQGIMCYMEEETHPFVVCDSDIVSIEDENYTSENEMIVVLHKNKNGVAMVHFEDLNDSKVSFYVMVICK